MTDEHNTDAADRAALAADREHIAELAAVKVMGATTALQHIVRQDHTSMRIPALMQRIAADGLLSPALRVWSLVLAELGPPRLPGGELIDRDGKPPVQVMRVTAPEALAQPWLDELRAAGDAAVERDGTRLWDHIERGLDSHPMSFAASSAVSAVNAIEQLHVRDEVLALACLLGHAGDVPQRWSVAGQCFRLCHAFQMSHDLGPHLGFTAIAPEFETLVKMPPVRRLTALAIMAASTATIIGGDPAKPIDFEIEIVADPSGLGESYDQRAAANLALGLIKAYRDSDPKGPGRIVTRMRGAEPLWAMWAVANILAGRVRELWRP
jgi:hypothetical protein